MRTLALWVSMFSTHSSYKLKCSCSVEYLLEEKVLLLSRQHLSWMSLRIVTSKIIWSSDSKTYNMNQNLSEHMWMLDWKPCKTLVECHATCTNMKGFRVYEHYRETLSYVPHTWIGQHTALSVTNKKYTQALCENITSHGIYCVIMMDTQNFLLSCLQRSIKPDQLETSSSWWESRISCTALECFPKTG